MNLQRFLLITIELVFGRLYVVIGLLNGQKMQKKEFFSANYEILKQSMLVSLKISMQSMDITAELCIGRVDKFDNDRSKCFERHIFYFFEIKLNANT